MFPGGGAHITICVSHVWEHIAVGICVSHVWEHIAVGICVSQVGDRVVMHKNLWVAPRALLACPGLFLISSLNLIDNLKMASIVQGNCPNKGQ